jgi:hypothetical protein
MVAIVTPSSGLSDIFNYNENKVKAGDAECLMAVGYPKDLSRLGDTEKLKRLQNQAALNTRTENNAIHVTLNFHSSDKLDNEKLKAIAETYMKKIGFGDQPYLVYKHTDAGHPHIHIVTTNIKPDGKGISTYRIGERISSPAREQIEKDFGLIRAKGRGEGEWQMPPVNPQVVQYGKAETKKAVTNVVNFVTRKYKYTSIEELNIILKSYNVLADRGQKDSKMYQKEGLVFRVLGEDGNKIGVPIKASTISTKPILGELRKRFELNKKIREPFKEDIKRIIDWTILQNPGISISRLEEILLKDQIQMVINKNDQGLVYGITYVDHGNKTVFKGSDLGKEYAAGGILKRCETPAQEALQPDLIKKYPSTVPWIRNSPVKLGNGGAATREFVHNINRQFNSSGALNELAYTLVQTEVTTDTDPGQYASRKKRRKKRRY